MLGLLVALTKRPLKFDGEQKYQCSGKCIMRVHRFASSLSVCVYFRCLICARTCKIPRESLKREMLGHW